MFAQPWAWLGLAGLAVPLAIHLLARHTASRTRVPSLRFIDTADVRFVRLRTLTDVPLLIVRLAIVLAAVVALAGPRWPGGSGAPAGATVAIVVDTSQGAAGDEGRAAARQVAAEAARSVVVEAPVLDAGIASAARWLSRQTGTRRLTVVSDFQRGSVTAAAFDVAPAGVGIQFVPLTLRALPWPAGFSRQGEQSRMTWPAAPPAAVRAVRVLAGAAQADADAMLAAVAGLSVAPSVDATARQIVLVFPAAAERAAVLAAPAIDQPWMFDVVAPVLADVRLRRAVTARAWQGGLALVVDAAPLSDLAAAVAAAAVGASAQPLAWTEFDAETIAPQDLAAWQRPSQPGGAGNDAPPQGRWLWGVVLALLLLETVMRRSRPVPSTAVEVGRVA